MIIPMQKIALLVLGREKESALAALRELGAMHIEHGDLRETGDRAAAAAAAGHIERLIAFLETLDIRKTRKGRISVDVEPVIAELDRLMQGRERRTRDIDEAVHRIEQLEKWGEFDGAMIDRLAAGGIYVSLCEAQDAAFRSFHMENATVREISRTGTQVAFAVISDRKPDPDTLPLATLPTERSLEQARGLLQSSQTALAEIDDKLRVIAANDMALLRARFDQLSEQLVFLSARDAMTASGEIAILSGFVPDDRMEAFSEAAKSNGWAYLANPADERKEPVPTLIRMPKWVRVVQPLFDFLGIVPGYSEVDASAIVLVFFTLFFGILVGDAGYGLVFALAAFPAAFLTRGGARQASSLVALLSLAAIAWGVLTNNYFGCSLGCMKPLECSALASAVNKDSNVQFLCFTLGLVQLMLGHCWKIVRDSRWRNVGSQLGWLLMMVANFCLIRTMIVYPGTTDYPSFMLPCYGAGILLVAVCEVQWTDPGSVLGFPFNLINSFVDLLSYIRLFAVGLAGYYLAYSFNGIARDMFAAGPVMSIGAVVLLLFGHALNIGLCVLAVLVHGVRLNTLEFSSHVGLQWSGFAYRPFAKENKSNS